MIIIQSLPGKIIDDRLKERQTVEPKNQNLYYYQSENGKMHCIVMVGKFKIDNDVLSASQMINVCGEEK